MTLDEKLQLVHGNLTIQNGVSPRNAAGWVLGIPRLGISDLLYADGALWFRLSEWGKCGLRPRGDFVHSHAYRENRDRYEASDRR